MITATLNRILVPTDFSDTASHALRYASDLARRLGASLTVLYSDSFAPPIEYSATGGGWDANSLDELKGRAEEQLQGDARTNIDRSVLYDTVVRVAMPREGILAQARESGAGLIVMGTHGRTGFRRLMIGSVTESVMRRAEVPVLAVPSSSATSSSMKTIVCPAIYNPQCRAALNFAAQIAPPDARFIIIRATRTDDVIQSADDRFELRAWVPEAIATRCELRMFRNEHVADQIESFAESAHADLIVTAEPADRTVAAVLLGTFAERLTQHSECPVLTMNGLVRVAVPVVGREEVRTDLVAVTV